MLQESRLILVSRNEVLYLIYDTVLPPFSIAYGIFGRSTFFAKVPEGQHLKELTNLQLIFLPRAFERVKNVVWKCFIKQR